jgi:hypothetical protein
MVAWSMLAGVLAWAGLAPVVQTQAQTDPTKAGATDHHGHPGRISHVLLISVDGMHAVDLANYIRTHSGSTLAALSGNGVTYSNASSSQPSDSFPGLLALLTGGTPKSTGVYYDNSYDRSLSAPGSNCSTQGTQVLYDESVEINSDYINGGGGIDPNALPRDPAHGCQPVSPHSYPRVNNIFEVAKAANLRTAWSDKHLAYDIVNGPSGNGVDDLYTPEIVATKNVDGSCLYADCRSGDSTVTDTMQYDNFKVNAIINEIDGKDHAGAGHPGVPAIFGMNFQSVSVGQKAPTGGYVPDAHAVGGFAPTGDTARALAFVDSSLHRMVTELDNEHLRSSTLVVVTAKHGQAPIDRSLLSKIGHSVSTVLGSAGITPAQVTDDDVALVWLSQHSQTQAAVNALATHGSAIGISNPSQIRYGNVIERQFGNPLHDPRVPDIIVTPNLGVIYTGSSKIAEHGGFSHDDTNVALLVSNPRLEQETVRDQVQTTQVAPTILEALGLRSRTLQAVNAEHTHSLPELQLDNEQ